MPDCKILYLLRNPIERMWSDLAMYQSKKFGGDGIGKLSEDEMLGFLTDSQHLASSGYMDNLLRWQAVYPDGQIFVGFYDQVCADPKTLMQDIYRFLGVDASSIILGKIETRKVNAQVYSEMPEKVGRILTGLLMGEIASLHQHFANAYTGKWLRDACNYLAVAA